MSYEPSKYQTYTNENYVANIGFYDARLNINMCPQGGVSSTPHSYEQVNNLERFPVRAQNIHINPNSLNATGTVYINKNKLGLNQNAQSVPPHLNPKIGTPLSENNVHYNPKFLKCSQKPLTHMSTYTQETSKTIHINPSFARKKDLSEKFAFSSGSSSKNIDRIFINPKFVEKCDTVLRDDSKSTNHQMSIENSYSQNVETKSLTELTNKQFQSTYNSAYCKINSSMSNYNKSPSKVSIYKIQRNNSKINFPNDQISSKIESPKHNKLPARKPRLSGSFKKIGKRKLVHKSLIQKYIASRRQTLPSMIQHSRNTLASKRKLKFVSKSRFKLVHKEIGSKISPLPNLARYKERQVIPAKFKLKWSRADNARIQDFIKLGKNKIVRKSILQSILEARRSRLNNSRLYSLSKRTGLLKDKDKIKSVKSRYKVIRNVASLQQNSNRCLDSRSQTTAFVTNKKIGGMHLINSLTSKSILYRLPPSLRLKMKFEERRKRMMLLKKINNRKKCLFYNRFGYCKGQDEGTCKKMHDPKSLAICNKYLKGLCDGNGCKLSHQVIPEKMPTCHQFLAGVCVRPSCPFQHVKVSGDQPICFDFLQGFCQYSDSCTKRHQFICPEWAEKGCCKSDKCNYPHPTADKIKNQTITAPLDRDMALERNSVKDIDEAHHDAPIKAPADDSRNRYFTDDSERNESDTAASLDRDNASAVERKPELKDGLNSVYKNDSLLSFIPFS